MSSKLLIRKELFRITLDVFDADVGFACGDFSFSFLSAMYSSYEVRLKILFLNFNFSSSTGLISAGLLLSSVLESLSALLDILFSFLDWLSLFESGFEFDSNFLKDSFSFLLGFPLDFKFKLLLMK